MLREAEEEAGIGIRPEDLQVVQVMHRKSSEERIDYFFVAMRWEGEISNMEPHKCDQLRWFPLDDLPMEMVPYVRAALDNYVKGLTFTKFGWAVQ